MAGGDSAGSLKLDVISLSADQVVVRRGARQVLLDGPGVAQLTHMLIPGLEEGRNPADLLAQLSEEDRQRAAKVLHELRTGGVVPPSRCAESSSQVVTAGHETLRETAVAVLGRTFIARSLVRALLELGVGRVVLVDLPELASPGLPSLPLVGLDAPIAGAGGGRLEILPALPPESDLREFSALCGTTDSQPREALLDANRLALRLAVPYLPVSLAGAMGYLGPLTIPRRTACLRCALPLTPTGPSSAIAGAALTAAGGMLGEMAALHLSNVLLRARDETCGRLLTVDTTSLTFTYQHVVRLRHCADCGVLGEERGFVRVRPRKARLDAAALRT